MKKIFYGAAVVFIVISATLSYGDVIKHDKSLFHPDLVITEDDMSREINSKYSVMELVNGQHDGKEYGTIKFCEIAQTANSNDKTPMEWYILEKKDGKAVLMSKHIISYHSYDTDAYTDWNDTRIKKLFDNMLLDMSAGEREMIVSNPYRNVGKIFLLTVDEANYYLSGNRIDLVDATPVDSAVGNGKPNAFWLENNNLLGGGFAPYVNGKTMLNSPKIDYTLAHEKMGIRPCVIVNYSVNNELQASLQPETFASDSLGFSHTASAFKNVAEIGKDNQTFVYDTEEDGKQKKFNIQIQLPIYTSDDQAAAEGLNNLVRTSGYEILKLQAGEYVEDNLSKMKSHFIVSSGAITVNGDNTYVVVFKVGDKTLCHIKFDLNNNTCVLVQQ